MYISVNIEKQSTLIMDSRWAKLDELLAAAAARTLLGLSAAAVEELAVVAPASTLLKLPAAAKPAIIKKGVKKTFQRGDTFWVIWKYTDRTYKKHTGTIIAIDRRKKQATVIYDDGKKHKHTFYFLKTCAKMIVSS